jgi:predicted nuclease of predicted toxin-antitoxin system
MKFIVDAQLPIRLARFLTASGYDTLHTRDLPQQNATSDTQINEISIQQNRVVITKDSDFVDSFMTIQKPYKLLLISTGNIKNSELEKIFSDNLSMLVNLLQHHDYIEVSRDRIIVHQ